MWILVFGDTVFCRYRHGVMEVSFTDDGELDVSLNVSVEADEHGYAIPGPSTQRPVPTKAKDTKLKVFKFS